MRPVSPLFVALLLASGAGGCMCRASTGRVSLGLAGIVLGSLVD